MLLGENGTGKSSILQAIALALVGDEYRSRLNLDAASFVRRGSGSGYVEVALSGTRKPLHLSFSKRGFVSSDSEPKVLVLGYGATRLLARGTTAYRTAVVSPFARVENLFNPFAPLGEKVEWLFALPPRRFASVAEALRRILSLEQEAEFRRNSRSRRVEVEAYGVRVPLEHLSDGYQSVIALALDIMSVMLHRWPAMEVAEGIVLADELGAHLHPRWRMQIVKALREAFPRVQFVSSTHDPLCLRGMRDGEVLVLRRRPDGTVYPLLDAPPVEGLRVEQILTSEHFGLNSTVDPEIDELFERYYTLKGRWSLNAKEEKEHGELAARLDKMRLLGRTRRERIMLEAADEYLAVERRTESSSDRVRLQQSTKQKIAAMWRDAEPATEMEPQR
jgi:hypothetical protein